VNKKGRPVTYRELRNVLSQRLLLRETFDLLLEQTGIGDLIASQFAVQTLMQRREKPTPEEFKKLEGARAYIKQRLPDRLYYAALLTVMESMPAALGEEVQVGVIEQLEKGAVGCRSLHWGGCP
jgi:hypothetical protein